MHDAVHGARAWTREQFDKRRRMRHGSQPRCRHLGVISRSDGVQARAGNHGEIPGVPAREQRCGAGRSTTAALYMRFTHTPSGRLRRPMLPAPTRPVPQALLRSHCRERCKSSCAASRGIGNASCHSRANVLNRAACRIAVSAPEDVDRRVPDALPGPCRPQASVPSRALSNLRLRLRT